MCWRLPGWALAVLLEAPDRPPSAPRRWHRPERATLPAEPGRVVFCALLAAARRARGCRTLGDDRIETRAYAVKRALWRLGHAQRSGRFACSVEQLVVGLAAALGWTVPADAAGRRRFVRAHRKSVQRWLADLERAGLVAVDGERDNRGQWWRTVITLLEPPAPAADELACAAARQRSWRRRSRRRRRRARRQPSLEAIRARAVRPRRSTRRTLALTRACALHERRRRAQVDATIAAGRKRRCELSTHPYGAPLAEAPSQHPAQTSQPFETVFDQSGACASGQSEAPASSAAAPNGHSTEKERIDNRWEQRLDELVVRVARQERQLGPLRQRQERQLLERAVQVAGCPAGRASSWGLVRAAWTCFRFGVRAVAERGAAPAGRAVWKRSAAAVVLYEAFADQRPDGWPAGGWAALCALASQRRAATIAGDVARLLVLAKAMRATALHTDPGRLDRARRRAQRRADARAELERRGLRRPGPPRVETGEHRRRRERDELLLSGEHPGLSPDIGRTWWDAWRRHDAGAAAPPEPADLPDGLTARAHRYRDQLAAGAYTLSSLWPRPAP